MTFWWNGEFFGRRWGGFGSVRLESDRSTEKRSFQSPIGGFANNFPESCFSQRHHRHYQWASIGSIEYSLICAINKCNARPVLAWPIHESHTHIIYWLNNDISKFAVIKGLRQQKPINVLIKTKKKRRNNKKKYAEKRSQQQLVESTDKNKMDKKTKEKEEKKPFQKTI